jgi:twitching motility protein PilJ
MSMEKSTSGVVDGARIAEGAGGALEEIENVSIRLARLIETISEDSRKQSTRAVEISRAMNQISQVTAENTTGTRQTALSIGELAWLADELRRSVAGFKLPQGETAAETPRAAVLSAAAGTA